MTAYRKRLHLDRTEVLVGLGLVVLTCGLMFTLGVLVGYGLHPNAGSMAENAELALSHATREAVGEAGDGHERGPASESAGTRKPAGADLKRAFQESKQRALVDMALSDTPSSKPKSVVDAEAHFEAVEKPAEEKLEANRAPASAPTQVVKKDEPSQLPSRVKSLFERAPASIEEFSPVSGSYTVQIASYATLDESKAKVVQLRKSGFNEAYVKTIRLKNGETWYRVGVGAFPSSSWAQKAGDKLLKRKLASDFVVRQVN